MILWPCVMNSSLPLSFVTLLLRTSSTCRILGQGIPPILLKSCKVIIITKMDVPVFIHLSQWSWGEDFFAVNGNKKKWTDEPKTSGVWQSTGFSSLKQHRLSRHAGGEQIWFSVWWSDSHKLPILIFSFLACLPFTVCYKPFCAWYSVSLFSPPKVFFWYNVESTYSHTICKKIQQSLQFKLWVFEKTQNQISITQVRAHIYFILWQHRKFITEQLSLHSSRGDWLSAVSPIKYFYRNKS